MKRKILIVLDVVAAAAIVVVVFVGSMMVLQRVAPPNYGRDKIGSSIEP